MGKRGPQPVDRDMLEVWYGAWLGIFEGMRSGRNIRKDLNFQDEQGLWARLLNARTAAQVRAVCKQSPFWLNPKRGSVEFYRALTEHADVFLAAKKDRRCPKSDRPTNEGKRIRFLARSMAGVMMGISTRTAQDLLAKTEKARLEAVYRPVCECGHRERDHANRGSCKYCICAHFRYSGGRVQES